MHSIILRFFRKSASLHQPSGKGSGIICESQLWNISQYFHPTSGSF